MLFIVRIPFKLHKKCIKKNWKDYLLRVTIQMNLSLIRASKGDIYICTHHLWVFYCKSMQCLNIFNNAISDPHDGKISYRCHCIALQSTESAKVWGIYCKVSNWEVPQCGCLSAKRKKRVQSFPKTLCWYYFYCPYIRS